MFFRGSLVGFNKLLRVGYTFHDANIDLTVRDRNHNLSFSFRINIICGRDPAKKAKLAEDAYWYPWRGPGDLRD